MPEADVHSGFREGEPADERELLAIAESMQALSAPSWLRWRSTGVILRITWQSWRTVRHG